MRNFVIFFMALLLNTNLRSAPKKAPKLFHSLAAMILLLGPSRDAQADISPPKLQMAPEWTPEEYEKFFKKHNESDQLKAGLSLAGIHSALYLWAYFAWYMKQDKVPFHFEKDGWFEHNTYAGGMDKLGHFQGNQVLHRLTQQILEEYGLVENPFWRSFMSTFFTLAWFSAIEIKDGLHNGYGFSRGDMVFNFLGNAVSIILENCKKCDRVISTSLTWTPSDDFINKPSLNGAEQYDDQRFIVFANWDELAKLTKLDPYLVSMPGFQIGIGYGVDGYKPVREEQRTQSIYLYFGYKPTQTENFQKLARKNLFLRLATLTDEHFGVEKLTAFPGPSISYP